MVTYVAVKPHVAVKPRWQSIHPDKARRASSNSDDKASTEESDTMNTILTSAGTGGRPRVSNGRCASLEAEGDGCRLGLVRMEEGGGGGES